jgi:hypothetical protein
MNSINKYQDEINCLSEAAPLDCSFFGYNMMGLNAENVVAQNKDFPLPQPIEYLNSLYYQLENDQGKPFASCEFYKQNVYRNKFSQYF